MKKWIIITFFFLSRYKKKISTYYQRNKERLLEQAKQYYENSKERLKEKARKGCRNYQTEKKT